MREGGADGTELGAWAAGAAATRATPLPGGFAATYRDALQRSLGRTAIPYGYTVLNTMAAGVLIDTHGPPTVDAALLFLCGAVLGFALVARIARVRALGASERTGLDPARLGLCSGVAAIAALSLSAAIAHAVPGAIAFGAVALGATVVYLGVGALGAALIERRDQEGARDN